jgi:hypothetical protein
MAQGQVPRVSRGHGPADERSGLPSGQTIREELDRVLAGHEFRASKRSREFLRYIVETTLQGRAENLKERTIGVDVFGRPPSYDPSEDATVRVKAGEVRKRLGLYYAGEGAKSAVRIELPAGTYVPEFRPAPSEASALESPEAISSKPVILARRIPEPPPVRRKAVGAGVVLAAASILAVALFLLVPAHRPNSALEQFWAPVLKGSSPVSLCLSYVPVWGLRDPTAIEAARRNDFVPITDQFVGGGDLLAVSGLVSMLTSRSRPFQVRIGNEVSFEDLRDGPAILIGYSYTRWKEISSQMRFFIDTTRPPLGVTDNGKPTPWILPNLPPDRRTSEDYAIVSRVFHPDTRAMLVEIAGITQYGTAAAADMVTNPDLLAEAFRTAPAGWQKKNVQFVLHVKVFSGAPTSPKVVASYFW